LQNEQSLEGAGMHPPTGTTGHQYIPFCFTIILFDFVFVWSMVCVHILVAMSEMPLL
jgi:hypothetical protein